MGSFQLWSPLSISDLAAGGPSWPPSRSVQPAASPARGLWKPFEQHFAQTCTVRAWAQTSIVTDSFGSVKLAASACPGALKAVWQPSSALHSLSSSLHCPAHSLGLCVQTSIVTDGFRSLAEGEAVEFVIEHGDDGRTKAVQVTGPAGAPPQGQPRREYDQGYGGGGEPN